MKRIDLFTIGFGQRYLTVCWYAEPLVGWRRLGPRRYALDMWRLSLLFENYNPPKGKP